MSDAPAAVRRTAAAATLLLGLALTAPAAAEPPGVPVSSGGAVLRTAGDASLDRLVFPALPAGVTYTAVEAGAAHSLALRSDGKVDTAGNNLLGQRDLPVLAGTRYTAVSAGGEHTLALVSDGSVVAVGRTAEGQTSVPAPPPGTTYTAVAAGAYHSLVLHSDGTAAGYGLNTGGRATPISLALLPGVVYTALAAGDDHSLGLRSGEINAFGSNGSGQTDVPALPPGLDYEAVATGDGWSLALRSDGHLVAWGANDFGAVCDLPIPAPGTRFTAISAGEQFGIALRSDGLVAHWGKNDIGQGALPAPAPGTRHVAIGAGGAQPRHRPRRPADDGGLDPGGEGQAEARPFGALSLPHHWPGGRHPTATPGVCGGVVTLTAEQGKRVVARRVALVEERCAWSATLKAKGAKLRGSGRTTLKVKARYGGHTSATAVLQPARTTVKVRAR